MDIEILHLVEGAKKARGMTVIIDVFRAFSLACYMFDQGAEMIIPVGDIQTAYRLKAENPGYILVGERNNIKPPGFDFGNSPHQVRNFNFGGRTVVHTTSAGTQGIVNAVFSDEVLTGSFVNAGAITRYIRKKNPRQVTLVCMGYSANHPVEEDSFCAQYIKDSLEDRKTDFSQMVNEIKNTSGKRFFTEDMQEHCPSEDFYLCLALNRFDFILKAQKRTDGLINLVCKSVG
ncbi:MAG: 2-phosphosulfolactate phosphatase [Bacteroidales bacterium]|nr:2-phosphosulfolactate phosphatase [Bacteroidales bacterium]